MTSAGGRQIHWSTELLWTLPLHQITSTLGVLLLAGFVTFSTFSVSRARWILTETPYFPVQIGLAFVVGFVVQYYWRHWVMLWVWLVPLLVLLVSFILTPLPFVGRVERYFGWACRPEFRCFAQLAVTLPFYAATSYSFGAFLSRKISKSRETV